MLSLLFSQNVTLPSQIKRVIDDAGLSNNDVKKILDQNKPFINEVESDLNIEKNTQNIDNTNSKQKINKIKSFDNSVNDVEPLESNENSVKDFNDLDEDTVDDDKKDEIEDSSDDPLTEQGSSALNYFGYDVFRGDPDNFQMSNSISVDPSYIVGPGDEIILMLWGETEINTSYTISSEGYLFIDNIGQIFVNGLTMDKLEKKLFKLLSKVYSSLGSPSSSGAKTFDISLGGLSNRPLRIFVLGEVGQPVLIPLTFYYSF